MIIAIALIALDCALAYDAAVRILATHRRPLLHTALAACAAVYTSVLFSTEPPAEEPIVWVLCGAGTIALAALVAIYATHDAEEARLAEAEREERLAEVRNRIAARRGGR